jgi:hypothetical protein
MASNPSIGGSPAAFASAAAAAAILTVEEEAPLAAAPQADRSRLKEEWLLQHPCPRTDEHQRKGRCRSCGHCKKCNPTPLVCDSVHEHIGSQQAPQKQRSRSRTRSPRSSRGSTSPTRVDERESIPGAEVDAYLAEQDEEHKEATKKTTGLKPLFAMLGVKNPARTTRITDGACMSESAKQELIRTLSSAVGNLVEMVVGGDTAPVLEALAAVLHDKHGAGSAGAGSGANANKAKCNNDTKRVFDNTLSLCVHGSTSTRRIAKALLISSSTKDRANEYLQQAGYSQVRKNKVVENKQERNEQRRRGAAKRKLDQNPDPLVLSPADVQAEKSFDKPFTNTTAIAKFRKEFKEVLLEGKDIQNEITNTNRLPPDAVAFLVGWLKDTMKFRPGTTRNVLINGEWLWHVPVYTRDTPIATMFQNYKEAAEAKSAKAVGQHNFYRITDTLCKKGRVSQGEPTPPPTDGSVQL